MAAWAFDPAMSWAAIRLSNPIEAFIASMIASGPAAKRPPHIWFEELSAMPCPSGGKMRLSRSALLYPALALGAIVAGLAVIFMASNESQAEAPARDYSTLAAGLSGDMKKLAFHSTPKAVSDKAFSTGDDGSATLADYKGKYVLLNFWATWCAPCRKEMPMLSELQTEFGGADFEVLTLATGRNPVPAIKAFFDEIGVTNLPMARDPQQRVARDMGVLGLPITVLLDPEGREVARLQGDAHWSDDSAKALIAGLLQPTE
jgi:thiol-disulfide isomerase/thioredoxin